MLHQMLDHQDYDGVVQYGQGQGIYITFIHIADAIIQRGVQNLSQGV